MHRYSTYRLFQLCRSVPLRGYVQRLTLSILLISVISALGRSHSNTLYKRNRAEQFSQYLGANTVGRGNIWIALSGEAHVWDNPMEPSSDDSRTPPLLEGNLRGFPAIYAEMGVLSFAMIYARARLLTWGWNSGPVSAGTRLTVPNNSDLRLHGLGVDIRYLHHFTNTHPTIAGYVGFMPDGIVAKGGSVQVSTLYEADLPAKWSHLPIKLGGNIGFRLPLAREYRDFNQYLVRAAAGYIGRSLDFYLEYSYDGFFNTSVAPRLMKNKGGGGEFFWIAFSENPMYLTPGGRFRYPNGILLHASIPILLSTNWGSTKKRGPVDLESYPEERPPEGIGVGSIHGFDPWFAKWRVVLSVTIPLRYRHTAAEMRRSFLLQKNRKRNPIFDLEKRLSDPPVQAEDESESDTQRRLERIRKQRESLKKESRSPSDE